MKQRFTLKQGKPDKLLKMAAKQVVRIRGAKIKRFDIEIEWIDD